MYQYHNKTQRRCMIAHALRFSLSRISSPVALEAITGTYCAHCMCVCMCVCTYVHCRYVCMYICVYICMYVCMYVYVCVYVCI
jgi:hypothetical protein